MYEVRSKVHGFLTFSRVGRAFGSYGQTGEMGEKDLKDPEVKKALGDGRLEIVAERVSNRPPEGEKDKVLLSKKDWDIFREVMLECAERISSDLREVLRDEGEKIREALSAIPVAPGSRVGNPILPTGRSRRVREESSQDYVITPDRSNTESRVDLQESSEDGEDMRAGLAALRSLREEDGDGR